MAKFSYQTVPAIYRRRNSFPLNWERTTSMKVGELTPTAVIEMNPSDGIYGNVHEVAQLINAFYRPVMGRAFIDVHAFFVPLRLVYNRWEEVMGENKQSAWAQQNPVDVPTYDDLGTGQANVVTDSVFDHLYGMRAMSGVSVNSFKISPLAARAFALIYDTWYRNENVVPPMQIQKGEVTASEVPNANEWAPNNYVGMLPKVMKLKDRFTSSLPAPQKGESPLIPFSAPGAVGNIGDYGLPVIPKQLANPSSDFNKADDKLIFAQNGSSGNMLYGDDAGLAASYDGNTSLSNMAAISGGGGIIPGTVYPSVYPANLFAQVTGFGADTSELRLAIQTQRILERAARYGTRYLTEYIPSTFGIQNPAAIKSVIPEYVCGWRQPVGGYQVTQTATDADGLGVADRAAFGHAQGSGRVSFTATEHGYLIFCASIRQIHVYQQGVHPMFFRKSRWDFYDPDFARISEQPIYKREVYFSGLTESDESVLGYTGAWNELRSMPNQITGQARSGAFLRDGSTRSNLDVWHFGDNYTNAPSLNSEFVQETNEYIDRTIQNMPTDGRMDEFLVQFGFILRRVAELPVDPSPGLVDHTYVR